MKNSILSSIVIAIFLLSLACFSQESAFQTENETKITKLRPVRIGVKVGFPNILGGNVEYVTPLLNKRLALNMDYSMVNSDWLKFGDHQGYDVGENEHLEYRYIEGGINYYFFKPGKGLYGTISYGTIKVKGTLTDIGHSEDPDTRGTGHIDHSHSAVNIKLGSKWGGLFYIRSEVGYTFKTLPKSVNMEVAFADSTRQTQMKEFETDPPYNILFSGLIANFGIGFAF